MLELSAIFVYEYLHVYFNMENRKKQGSLGSFFCSKPKQPKLQLNEEPDKVKETGIPVEAEKLKRRRFQQWWKTKYMYMYISLKYDKAKDAIYCTLCQDNGRQIHSGNMNICYKTGFRLKHSKS